MPNHGHYNLLNVKLLKESFTSLLLSAVTAVFAGIFLGTFKETFILLPGLIVLIPAAIGMRGNIFAALGSRLGSAFHLGTITRFDAKNRTIRNNIHSSFTLTIILSVFLGFLAKFLTVLFGIESMSLFSFILISFIGGMISGLVMLATTFGIAFLSYRRGWDPDNVTSPMITALGDFFTIPSLLLAAFLVVGLGGFAELLAYSVVAMTAVYTAVITWHKKFSTNKSYRGIVFQSLAVLLTAGSLDGIAGSFIELNIDKLVLVPILLVLLPAFLEEGGNIGNILASRVSTKLHIGSIRPKLSMTHEVKREIANSMLSAYMIFPTVGFLTSVISSFAGIGGLGIADMVVISAVSGVLLHLIIIFFTFFVSILSYKYGFDPDNTTIPIMTSATDIIGTIALLFVIHIMGIV
ncbi:MAG: magnesium transporter [Candidatus Aenigmarchaeota archaeon]|nr:magnesium transporter [Candidatus Aenigmarchaeota archaeon]